MIWWSSHNKRMWGEMIEYGRTLSDGSLLGLNTHSPHCRLLGRVVRYGRMTIHQVMHSIKSILCYLSTSHLGKETGYNDSSYLHESLGDA